ncbi:CHASE2 domain-containing protein [Denitratisoma oestradiolicum]|uniref:Adenylate cyclase class-3/4/guanylyl cyclase n=1 Tax=Denitratisoma oestradiolicum TaxID=311182 RepID=A0A6S6Y2A0_9PROT|nr:adenylate/guanylate cyclase domain-containing protein [Denitratisoma oestradiolicum]CAB1371083.1 Adenylate cyclase class-3/4/guanylyl cyclase [Denitratisoma oestradiolicum]
MRVLIALLAVVVTLAIEWSPSSLPMIAASDAWFRDQTLRFLASDQAENRLALVDIDEASLQRLGPWPWPRDRLADVLEVLLGRYGARAVALDMVLPEPGSAPGDDRLSSLARHAPVVLAQALDYVARPVPLRVGHLAGQDSALPEVPAASASGFVANHAGLREARCIGNIGFVPDSDGVLRHLPLISQFESHRLPSLALALMQCAGTAVAAPTVSPAGFWRLPFARRWSAYTVVGAADLLAENAPDGLLSGRYVVVGSSALGLSDRVATPLSASTAGMLVHGAALTSLLDQQTGQTPTPWPGRFIAALFAILSVGLALAAFPRWSAGRSLALLTLLTLSWLGLAMLLIPRDSAFSPSAPLLSLLILLSIAIPFEWGRSQWESHRLLDMFRHYVAQPVLDELLRNRDKVDPLAPRHLEVTTLISDMEGYASLVEGMPLQEAVDLTRGFLDCLTVPVLAHGGTLDKYTGDGLMAFWGAPLPVSDHADQALDAAQEIRDRVAAFNRKRIAAGQKPVRVRIGIESGLAVAGDLGTPFRSAYTAVGDSVNVASRLQELARDLPHDIVIGATTARLARRHAMRALGGTLLRGRQQPLDIFTLASPAGDNGHSPSTPASI